MQIRPMNRYSASLWLFATFPRALSDHTQLRSWRTLKLYKKGTEEHARGLYCCFLCAGSEGHHLWAAQNCLRRGVRAKQQRQHWETEVHVHPRLQKARFYCKSCIQRAVWNVLLVKATQLVQQNVEWLLLKCLQTTFFFLIVLPPHVWI